MEKKYLWLKSVYVHKKKTAVYSYHDSFDKEIDIEVNFQSWKMDKDRLHPQKM